MVLDFPWYLRQARDTRTKKKLKYYENVAKRLDSQKKLVELKGKQNFPLMLGSFKFWLNDNNVLGSLDTYGEIFKEKHHTKLKNFSGKGDNIIIDLGANEGYYILKIKENSPNSKIIAVEPNPEAFRILQKNVRANMLKNVVLFKNVISEKTGRVGFEIVKGVTQIGGVKIYGKREWLERNRVRKIEAKSITLEKLMKLNKIKKVDLLKIDTEGNEMKILRSSKKILKCVDKIVIEYHGKKLRRHVKNFFEKNGFKMLLGERVDCGDIYFKKMR